MLAQPLTSVTPAIELRSLCKTFGGVQAVDQVSLSIAPGEFLTLLGPSGCGKTTLLRLIAGFEFMDFGDILLDGVNIAGVPAYRRDVNTVFQSYALFPHLSVRGNIEFGLRMRKLGGREAEQRISEVMELVSLQGLGDRKPDQLSGGQRQRVALARALVCRPKVLLLDEPMSALDAKLRHAMQSELKELQVKLGITFILVTHDQQEALAMSDRIALMRDGRIEQIGNCREIYEQPRNAYVADFLGRANILQAEIVEHQENTTRIRIAGGLMLSTAKNAIAGSEKKIAVSIRPERIRLSTSPIVSGNAFQAEVQSLVFKGAVTEIGLGLEQGVRLYAVGGAEDLSVGKRVYCQIASQDIVLLLNR